jgi:hypothetical protein
MNRQAIADMNRELADLSRSLSHSNTGLAVKNASAAMADLHMDLRGYRITKRLSYYKDVA